MTLREIKQAALDAAKAEVQKLENELAAIPAELLDMEESVWNTVKSWVGAL